MLPPTAEVEKWLSPCIYSTHPIVCETWKVSYSSDSSDSVKKSLQLQRCDCADFNNSFPVSASHLLSPGIWWWLVVTGLTFWHHRSSAKHSHIWSGAMLGWAEETDTVWRNSELRRYAECEMMHELPPQDFRTSGRGTELILRHLI